MNYSCAVPGCNVLASEQWAQVPLCGLHREAIRRETQIYYSCKNNGTDAEQRPTYYKIARKVPWSKVSLAERGRASIEQ